MGRRLKQIKRQDLGEFGKQVVDSLIDNGKKPVKKEENHEQIRCKVEIYEGASKLTLVDSFVVNTTNLDKTIVDITEKYGRNVQFNITNLYDEKIVAKRFAYTKGYGKDKEDRAHFNHQMDLVKKLHKMKAEGIPEDQIYNKFASFAARSYLQEIYNKSEDEIKQKLKNDYGNQSLGTNDNILSESIDTKKDIPDNGDHDKEDIESGDNNEE